MVRRVAEVQSTNDTSSDFQRDYLATLRTLESRLARLERNAGSAVAPAELALTGTVNATSNVTAITAFREPGRSLSRLSVQGPGLFVPQQESQRGFYIYAFDMSEHTAGSGVAGALLGFLLAWLTVCTTSLPPTRCSFQPGAYLSRRDELT